MNTPTRKQHFLTRFLMAGFACRKKRREIYTHVFRAGQLPFEDNIINIGGERDFYANPKDRPTEVILERKDTRHAQVINEIRQNRAIPSNSEPLLAEFVANLVWRTKNIRQRFTGLADTARHEALIQASNDNFYYNELARPYVDAERTKQLGDHAPRRVRRLWEKEQRKRLKEIRPVAFRVMESVSLTSAVQDAQVRLLEALPEHIPQAYMQLQWAISTSDHGPLILGDIGPIWRKEGETRFSVPLPYMIHEGGRLFLPISRSLLLVGYSPSSNQDTTVDYDQVNVGSARLSSEFFISAQNTDRECRYHALVGADRDDWIRQIAQQDLLNLWK